MVNLLPRSMIYFIPYPKYRSSTRIDSLPGLPPADELQLHHASEAWNQGVKMCGESPSLLGSVADYLIIYIYVCIWTAYIVLCLCIYIYKNDLTLLSFVLYYCFVLYSKLHSIMFIYLYIYISFCYYVILHNVMHACKYVCAYVCTSVCTFIYLYIYEFGCKPPMFVCHLHGRNRKRVNHEILVS